MRDLVKWLRFYFTLSEEERTEAGILLKNNRHEE
jgi:hypothetical protein